MEGRVEEAKNSIHRMYKKLLTPGSTYPPHTARAGRVCGYKTSWKKALERLISYHAPHPRPALHLKPTPMTARPCPQRCDCRSFHSLELMAAIRRCQIPGTLANCRCNEMDCWGELLPCEPSFP
ncbi:unnamed protein product [Gulo gulo]|uniref:Uncharacterized protein n=1 Tax=Gulo gulo TaxID=48420 RepID=A0A9X9QB66_GULGU|nr:unnamed protein product [Gulo gulo]